VRCKVVSVKDAGQVNRHANRTICVLMGPSYRVTFQMSATDIVSHADDGLNH